MRLNTRTGSLRRPSDPCRTRVSTRRSNRPSSLCLTSRFNPRTTRQQRWTVREQLSALLVPRRVQVQVHRVSWNVSFFDGMGITLGLPVWSTDGRLPLDRYISFAHSWHFNYNWSGWERSEEEKRRGSMTQRILDSDAMSSEATSPVRKQIKANVGVHILVLCCKAFFSYQGVPFLRY